MSLDGHVKIIIDDLNNKNKALQAERDKLRGVVNSFMAYFAPEGGVSQVPLGPFERALAVLNAEQPPK